MTESVVWAWAGLLALGVWHGINPSMGWLFAVALGLQEGRARAVWRALGPLALGHALAIGGALAVAAALGLIVPLGLLRWIVAIALVAFGVWKLVRNRHPRWVGMRVGARDLTLWSLLMASAHGAGLMVLPFALRIGSDAGAGASGASNATAAPHHAGLVLADAGAAGIWATAVHTAGYLLVTGVLAVVVYRVVGLRLLRSAWVNLDVVWACALILTGILTPLL